MAFDASGDPPLPEMPSPDQAVQQVPWVWLARIRRPQGRKGEVFADILTDFPEKFAQRRRLWLVPEGPPTGRRSVAAAAEKPTPAASLRGSVKGHDFSRAAKPAKPDRALAPEGSSSETSPREVTLANHWLHKDGIVLHFSGIDSIGAAETLAGLMVAIPHAQRAVLEEGEAYIGDLIGCVLVDVAGVTLQVIGKIEDVDRTAGPVALLVVRGPADEILIPFAKSYLRKIDLKAKRVEMALPEGLTDLNTPEKP